jgi:hypothetical protein
MPRFDILQLCSLWQRSGPTIKIAKISSKYDICIKPTPLMGMQALIYHRSAAQRIVREVTEISAPIDNLLFRNDEVFGLRIAAVRPAVVVHADFQSTIDLVSRPKAKNKIWRELHRGMNCLRRTASFTVAWIGR